MFDTNNISVSFAREIIHGRSSEGVETILIGPSQNKNPDERFMVQIVIDERAKQAIVGVDKVNDEWADLVSMNDVEEYVSDEVEADLEAYDDLDGATEVEHKSADWESVADVSDVAERLDTDIKMI